MNRTLREVVFQFKCMKYVELCKFRLSHPGKLKTKVDLNVLCIIFVTFLEVVSIRADTLYISNKDHYDQSGQENIVTQAPKCNHPK